jgi:hypothetical protein
MIDKKQQGTEEVRSNAKDRKRPSDLPIGQWKPTRLYARQEGTVRMQESIMGREKLPTREVITAPRQEQQQCIDMPDTAAYSTSMNALTSQDEENPLLGELLKIKPRVDNPSIYMRQTFLGLTGCYYTLINVYAKQEGPLRNLLLKVPVDNTVLKAAYHQAMSNFKLGAIWTQEHTKAFLDLKTAIMSRPVLQAPRYNGSHFVITSDGCIEGFAAVLVQRMRTQTPAGKWMEHLHPLGFASKRTLSMEKKYKSYLLEFTALKFGLDKFSSIIWGFTVKIETDCSAMKDTLLNPHLNVPHARWREGILAYHIVYIRHVPGKLNVIADGLS